MQRAVPGPEPDAGPDPADVGQGGGGRRRRVRGTGVGPLVVCAPNAFKGALSAVGAAAAMARGVRASGGVPRQVPVADGGDGTLDVLLAAAGERARTERVDVAGPVAGRVRARLGWTAPGTAVVELAEASGLRLLGAGARDPLRATSRGAGELVAAALDRGAEHVVVGVGGSACTDGGAGLAAALGARLLDATGAVLPDGGGALHLLARIDTSAMHPGLRRCRLEVAVDVRSPLLGPDGAAAVFGPQKGASPEDVAHLEAGLETLASIAERDAGVDPGMRDLPGAGAAGGAGYGLAALCGAALVPGAALVCDAVGLDEAMRGAGLVLTGEGRLDASTAAGKAPREVGVRSRRAGVVCVVLAGVVDDPVDPLYARAVAVGAGLPPAESVRRTAALLERAAATAVRELEAISRPR